jgi:hypothetical protein
LALVLALATLGSPLGLAFATYGLTLATMGLTLGSIGSPNFGSAGDSSKESSLTSKAFNILEVIAILRPVDVFVGIKFKTHFATILHGN